MADALDETLWAAPHFFQSGDPFWLQLHANNVHFYFYESPFFDRMSNNSSILSQAKVDMSKQHLIAERKLFEQAVKDMPSGGLEFMIISEPSPLPGGGSSETYIMQKQNRRKQPGQADEIEILGQWLIIGSQNPQIIQAHSIFDIFSSRLLSISRSLSKCNEAASALPIFTPAAGHTYLPLSSKKTVASAAQSRANTPPPESSSQSNTNKLPSARSQSKRAEEKALMDTLHASLRYGSEYMDENPLQGEPGKFVFSSSNAHIQRQQQEAQAKAAATIKAMQESVPVSAVPTAAPTPKSAAAEPLSSRKATTATDKSKSVVANGAGKPKRRKSKAPITPVDPSPPPSR